jgi:hypothetical protein
MQNYASGIARFLAGISSASHSLKRQHFFAHVRREQMLKSAKPSWKKLLLYRDQLFAPVEKNEEAENNIPDSPESEKHTGSKCRTNRCASALCVTSGVTNNISRAVAVGSRRH